MKQLWHEIVSKTDLKDSQNLTLATKTGPRNKQFTKNITAYVQHGINKCESLRSGKQLILHGNPSVTAKSFSPQMAVLRRHFFAEYAI